MGLLRFVSILFVLMLTACGSGDEMSDAEREAFRRDLIDKALNDEVSQMGNQFLAENRLKEGVIETSSGLQYKVLTQGKGARPSLDQVVEVAFEGRRVDGVVFDRADLDQPAQFPLKRLIKGLQEGLTLMSVGSEWELYVPAGLAYKATSPSEEIPANSTLIFKIKLLRVLDTQSES